MINPAQFGRGIVAAGAVASFLVGCSAPTPPDPHREFRLASPAERTDGTTPGSDWDVSFGAGPLVATSDRGVVTLDLIDGFVELAAPGCTLRFSDNALADAEITDEVVCAETLTSLATDAATALEHMPPDDRSDVMENRECAMLEYQSAVDTLLECSMVGSPLTTSTSLVLSVTRLLRGWRAVGVAFAPWVTYCAEYFREIQLLREHCAGAPHFVITGLLSTSHVAGEPIRVAVRTTSQVATPVVERRERNLVIRVSNVRFGLRESHAYEPATTTARDVEFTIAEPGTYEVTFEQRWVTTSAPIRIEVLPRRESQ